MNNKLLHRSELFLKKNASTILTCLGATGVVATTVMAVKATPKAMQLIEEAKAEKEDDLTKFETALAAAPAYIPAIIVGVTTISCIFGANILNKKTQAGLASAYALLDQTYRKYQNKVKELYGEDADTAVRTSMAKDEYGKEDIIESELPLFYDQYSNRYFNTTNETVLRAEYEINKQLSVGGTASLNDYYDLVGLPPVDYGEYVGWSAAQMHEMYWDDWLYFNHTKAEMDDGMVCWIIDYIEPFIEYLEY